MKSRLVITSIYEKQRLTLIVIQMIDSSSRITWQAVSHFPLIASMLVAITSQLLIQPSSISRRLANLLIV